MPPKIFIPFDHEHNSGNTDVNVNTNVNDDNNSNNNNNNLDTCQYSILLKDGTKQSFNSIWSAKRFKKVYLKSIKKIYFEVIRCGRRIVQEVLPL